MKTLVKDPAIIQFCFKYGFFYNVQTEISIFSIFKNTCKKLNIPVHTFSCIFLNKIHKTRIQITLIYMYFFFIYFNLRSLYLANNFQSNISNQVRSITTCTLHTCTCICTMGLLSNNSLNNFKY